MNISAANGPDDVPMGEPDGIQGDGLQGSVGYDVSGQVQTEEVCSPLHYEPKLVNAWTASRPGSRLIRPLRWIVHASGADQQGGTCSTSTTYTDQDYLSRASTLLTLHVTFHHMNQSPESARGTAKGKRHVEDYNIRYTASFTAPLQAVNCLRRPVQALNCLRRPAQALNEVPYVHQQ